MVLRCRSNQVYSAENSEQESKVKRLLHALQQDEALALIGRVVVSVRAVCLRSGHRSEQFTEGEWPPIVPRCPDDLR